MAKIGLMTWFTYDNYGSLLQCKALMKAVESLGYDVELINYDPKKAYSYPRSMRELIPIYSKKVINKIRNKNSHFETSNSKIVEFRDSLKKSVKCNNKSELFLLNEQYDAFVCGSDQIWAPTVYDENYFLSFVSNNNKKIAYAPSIGLPVIENEYVKKEMKKNISSFIHLSTREEQGANIIENLTGKKAQVVLDPTLLLSKENWKDDFIDVNDKDYLLAYFLGDNENYYKACIQISHQLNKKLIIIPTKISDKQKPEVIHDEIGPKEFLSLINQASLVLTDSFHGTIFSFNFHRPVISFRRFADNKVSQNSRIYNILKITESEQILYNGNIQDSIKAAFQLDFDKIDRLLKPHRDSSLDFLNSSLRNATSEMNHKKKITNDCTGCGVCSCICPTRCISLELNDKGFYSYKVDTTKCIECGLCSKVCGQANILNSTVIDQNTRLFASYTKNNEILLSSSSGGICTTIALHELKNGNPVFGCKYDYEHNIAAFDLATSIEEYNGMEGSKYIQAYTVDAFSKIRELKQGVIIGTPCQIGSIDLYLKMMNKRNHFLLVDIICHGVPSYHLWNKYLNNFGDINEIKFRNKKKGWRNKTITLKGKNTLYQNNENKDLFYHFFEVGNVYNECCYECKYRNKSSADIRVGDYWGPKYINNFNGVSMIIPFTEKGMSYLKELENLHLISLTQEMVDDYFLYQQIENNRKPLEYEDLLNELKNEETSLKKIDKKYNKIILKRRKLRKFIKKIRSVIK